MKYLLYIIAFLLAVTAVVGYQFLAPPVAQKDAAITINDKVVTREEFDRLFRSHRQRAADRREFIDSLITKELLIQESQREGIDREEPFRLSIQNFYEQSLIKTMVDRKFASLSLSVGDDELKQHLALLGKRFHLTVFSYETEEEAKRGRHEKGETASGCFGDLSREVREAVAPLRPGGTSGPVPAGGRFIAVRVDGAEAAPSCAPPSSEAGQVRRALLEEKKEKVISEWVAGLREKAVIRILVDERK